MVVNGNRNFSIKKVFFYTVALIGMLSFSCRNKNLRITKKTFYEI